MKVPPNHLQHEHKSRISWNNNMSSRLHNLPTLLPSLKSSRLLLSCHLPHRHLSASEPLSSKASPSLQMSRPNPLRSLSIRYRHPSRSRPYQRRLPCSPPHPPPLLCLNSRTKPFRSRLLQTSSHLRLRIRHSLNFSLSTTNMCNMAFRHTLTLLRIRLNILRRCLKHRSSRILLALRISASLKLLTSTHRRLLLDNRKRARTVLSGFSGNEYGYTENQRQNFYDSYSGPTGFGNRSVLGGHEDIKGLPTGQQQAHGAPGLPPSNPQSSQQIPPSSQAGSQTQPSAGQGPQQSYPPPLPYYYPYPQNQYYGSPYNSGYTVPQPFVKYPTVFQAGPPGPQSAPSPAAKQPPSAVQPQSPYGQSLYGQQHPSSAYEDIGYQHHTQHSHGQSVGGSLPSNEYGKHQNLYGAAGQGMQGFMGLGQSTGPSSGPPIGQRPGGGSPEAAYKPYGSGAGMKDVGSGVGVGVGQGGVGQGPQARGGVQQPAQAGFYGGQRFGGGSSTVPQSQQAQQHQPQGQGPQAHLGYPQGGSDANNFYSYQARQQPGYWQ